MFWVNLHFGEQITAIIKVFTKVAFIERPAVHKCPIENILLKLTFVADQIISRREQKLKKFRIMKNIHY